MLTWVLKAPLLFEDSSSVLFLFFIIIIFLSILHYKTLETCYFFKVLYFFKFIKHAIKQLIIISFDLLNTILLL